MGESPAATRHRPTGAVTPAPLGGREASAILERARELVDPVLRAGIESLPGSIRRIALYHFGWEHADGTPAAGHTDKAIRPALVLATAAALGGPEARRAAVRAAVAVELVHNAPLLYDGTPLCHRPTASTVFGDTDATLAGDSLRALALRLLAEDPHPASEAAAARLTDHLVTRAETGAGALLGCACALGALYAGASEDDVEALDAFGRAVAAGRMTRATGRLAGAVPEPGAAEGLLALAEYVTRRGG